MSWWEANQGRRRNITEQVGNINQTLAELARIRQEGARTNAGIMSDFTGRIGDLFAAKRGREFQAGEADKQRGLQRELQGAQLTSEEEIAKRKRELEASEGKANRATQERVAGSYADKGEETQEEKWDKILDLALQNATKNYILQNPGSAMKDPETGEIIGYKIPSKLYDDVRNYAINKGIPEETVDLFLKMNGWNPEAPTSMYRNPSNPEGVAGGGGISWGGSPFPQSAAPVKAPAPISASQQKVQDLAQSALSSVSGKGGPLQGVKLPEYTPTTSEPSQTWVDKAQSRMTENLQGKPSSTSAQRANLKNQLLLNVISKQQYDAEIRKLDMMDAQKQGTSAASVAPPLSFLK